MQREIAHLATRYKGRGTIEYPVTRYDGRRGLIDVVWLSGSNPVAAFEIDACLRKKSVQKLLTLDVPMRFWIYFGPKDATAFVCSADPQRCIHLVLLNAAVFV